jgi:outer membrane lipoprotein LolB
VTRHFLLLLLTVLLAGCVTRGGERAHAPSGEAERMQFEREAVLAAREDFGLVGRIAVRHGDTAGSGRFDWQQRGSAYTLNFLAPVATRNWRLEVRPGKAVLIEANGAVRLAASAEELLTRELDWRIPADALRYWVLGVRAPGSSGLVEYDADGQLRLIEQSGWTIRYEEFDGSRSPALPRKLRARSGDREVRIVVRRWTLG